MTDEELALTIQDSIDAAALPERTPPSLEELLEARIRDTDERIRRSPDPAAIRDLAAALAELWKALR